MSARRILFVSTSTALGGAEKTLHLLATGLPREAFEVAGVVSLKPKGAYAHKLEAAGIRVESLEMGRWPGPRDLGRLLRAIEDFRPDVVHAFLTSAIELCRVAKRFSRTPFLLVSSPRANIRFRHAFWRGLDRLLKDADDLLISECEASRSYLLSAMGYRPERVVTVLNGVDPASCSPREGEREQARGLLGLEEGDLLVGTVGRLDLQKGHIHLIEAVQSLAGDFPKLRLAIVGEGPLRKVLGERIMREGLSDRVWLLGEKPVVRPWLAAMDIFVLASLFEGLPNALLEAMGTGLPVVATSVDGTAEVVEDGRTGLLVASGDAVTLAAAIRKLAGSAELRSRFAQAGREDIRRRFTQERMLKDYASAYQRL